MSATIRAFIRFILILSLAAIGAGSASAQVTISPTSLSFGSVYIGLTSSAEVVTLTNTGAETVSVTSLSISLPFRLENGRGLVVQNIAAGKNVTYRLVFSPSAAQVYSSTATFTVSGTNYSTTLNGTGLSTAAVASISPTSINFGNVAVGSTSTENVTVTNKGTAEFMITAIGSYPPFSVGGFTSAVTLQAGQSFTFQVSYSATRVASLTGTVTLTYDVLPLGGVSLSGTGTVPSGLAITNYPTLPSAIQPSSMSGSYLATLVATGGKPGYHWSVSSGSLPSGLSLSTSGTISGTISSSVAVGNYPFTVMAQDSSKPPLSVTESITIPVAAPTGANCNDIDVDVPETTTPIVALNDLGTGTYQGYEGGLYPGGSDTDPSAHLSAGKSIAAGIQPINGYEVLLGIGVSYTDLSWGGAFEPEANADPAKNPNVVIIDGAEGGEDASELVDSTNAYWTQIVDYWVPGTLCGAVPCSTDQVVAVWVNNVDSAPPPFPTDATNLQCEYESIAQNIHQFFPNAVLAYFSSIGYTGYSDGVATTLPEPGAYEGGFGVQLAIADQINSSTATCGLDLNFNSALGTVEAPWMAWGPYLWANGLLARKDGTTWACTDFVSDGVHPSTTGGRPKIASFLLNFFKTDPTASPWFLAP
jgi:hypothetical protein